MANQAITDPKASTDHLTEQRFNVDDGDETQSGSRYDATNGASHRNAALAGHLTSLILVDEEASTERVGKNDRFGLPVVEPVAAKLVDGGGVSRCPHGQPD